ncbi:MAG TPA: glucose-1-phosphate adenylyltransferase subunit GlgD [Negativicutes bacterium]|jgi:glucose-1-phosphate adenylyltransferase
MKNVLGLINLNESEEYVTEITKHRPLAAVPFGGRYRLIDFVLSSMVNSGIQNVGILLRHKHRSLMDHLRSGKEWDLARKYEGLFILPPAPGMCFGENSRADIENFYHHLNYLANCRQKYVLITGSNMICNINYHRAFKFHQDMQADITILYKENNEENDCLQGTLLEVEPDGRVVDIAIHPPTMTGNKISMEMYIMERTLLMDLIAGCNARGGSDLVKDGFIKHLAKLKVYGYQHKGYLARIHSIKSYYRHNMELLKSEKWQDLFFKSGPVYTKVKDEAPVKYKEGAKVSNTMIANGCIIEGRVENSVLFRGVKVSKGAYIKDSIIMQKTIIAENAIVENVICDKDVQITSGKWLKGDKNFPLVVEKGTVI